MVDAKGHSESLRPVTETENKKAMVSLKPASKPRMIQMIRTVVSAEQNSKKYASFFNLETKGRLYPVLFCPGAFFFPLSFFSMDKCFSSEKYKR